MEKEELISLIAKVFPLHPKPNMTIHQSQLADQYLDREIAENTQKIIDNNLDDSVNLTVKDGV